jgi:hypothetical protein
MAVMLGSVAFSGDSTVRFYGSSLFGMGSNDLSLEA